MMYTHFKEHILCRNQMNLSKTWCAMPFKATQTTALSRPQKIYNCYLLKMVSFAGNGD